MNFTIDHYPWGQKRPFVDAEGSLTADDAQLTVEFDVREPEIRAAQSAHNSGVCQDSCAEFFLRPYLDDARYLNIEINPIGTVHFAVGESRHDRRLLPVEYLYNMDVRTTVNRKTIRTRWQVQFFLPYALIAQIYGKAPISKKDTILCNFYKCGDKLAVPHWGCWNLVETERPDFHRPEFFREVGLSKI
ncbi:MAG: carbohydrate-binding family 9-like protein [Oscillospiraceae bacterium]|nr:carbohydrate-binding family 9-like protein [Oscillospiraceae bacterium]